jgi:sarcosine oxidase
MNRRVPARPALRSVEPPARAGIPAARRERKPNTPMASESATCDVAVVGLGAMGSAAAMELSRRGAKVIGIDRFQPPHVMGSSHGETRITRQGVGEGEAYVPFVLASHRIWRELEAEYGDEILVACGALTISSDPGAARHHGKPDFVNRSIASAVRFGVPHETLSSGDIAARFPQFTGLTGREQGYFEPGGGFVRPEAAIAAQLRKAAALGATLRTGVEALSLRQEAGAVRIATAQGDILAGEVVVSAGAWAPALLGAPFDRIFTVRRQLLHWFELDDAAPFRPGASPVFIWMHGAGDSDYFYGFPPIATAGEPLSVKVATEQYATATTADAADRTVHPGESDAMREAHVAGRLAGVSSRAVRSAACLYTVTPDLGFVIDRHPDQDRVLIVSPCSGHGFKHSAGIGETVARLIAGRDAEVDLSAFALGRFAPFAGAWAH